MKNTFYAKISRMKYINRWGLMRNTITENIAEHSQEVAVLAHALGCIGNVYFNKTIDSNKLAILALYHDATEIVTGDMPTPIKYFAPEIKEAYKNVEHVASEQLVRGLPEELSGIYREILQHENEKELTLYLKAADKLSAFIKCIEELSMGNEDFREAYITIKESLDNIELEELDYFMEHFLPAYSLTIDEQAKG